MRKTAEKKHRLFDISSGREIPLDWDKVIEGMKIRVYAHPFLSTDPSKFQDGIVTSGSDLDEYRGWSFCYDDIPIQKNIKKYGTSKEIFLENFISFLEDHKASPSRAGYDDEDDFTISTDEWCMDGADLLGEALKQIQDDIKKGK